MSRARRRLESFRDSVKRRPPGKPSSKPRTTFKDRLMIWGALLLGLVVLLGVPLLEVSMSRRNSIRQRVDQWSNKLCLCREESSRLLEIEFDYHSHGNPFTAD